MSTQKDLGKNELLRGGVSTVKSTPVMHSNESDCDLAEHFGYLDVLRESGVTNMYGAGSYLQRDQGLVPSDARRVLMLWMKTFAHDKTPAERAAEALSV